MSLYIAQFVGTETSSKPISAVGRTANYAIESVREQLVQLLDERLPPQVDSILETGVMPAELALTSFERDAYAVLYGSADMRPHITVRRLPPNF